jgi:segregation and condensation protein A
MTYEVKTPVFEGPLDLLLQLITQHRLDVTELRLSDLVSQYLAHLDLMRSLDLEVTSEFLVIAATLIQLKARHLLPGDAEVDLDEDFLLAEERDRLLSRLLANLTFKDVAAVFALRLEASDLLVPRSAGLADDVTPLRLPVTIEVTADGLAAMASSTLARVTSEPYVEHLDLDLPSVSAAIADLRRRIDEELETDFERIATDLRDSRQLIAYFLALLELAKWGLITVKQDKSPLAPIQISRTDEQVEAFVSEWEPD